MNRGSHKKRKNGALTRVQKNGRTSPIRGKKRISTAKEKTGVLERQLSGKIPLAPQRRTAQPPGLGGGAEQNSDRAE